jgi:LacI family transcriptional regulator
MATRPPTGTPATRATARTALARPGAGARGGDAARPTILDVAREAGVSLGTVSNVLNDHGNVGARRRARVEEAIGRLGYVPNGLAQSLRRQHSRVIGLCLPLTSNAYFASLLDAFENLAAAQGYDLMQVLSRNDPALELRRVRALIARQVDGLIVVPSTEPAAMFDAIAAAGMAAVMVDRAYSDARFDYVTIDDREATAAAARALLDAGHRRLLFLARHPRLVNTRDRIRGFRDAVAATRGAIGGLLVRDPDDDVFAREFGARMTGRRRPTALVASNSDLALAILRNLRVLGLQCPGDVSLVAFDAPAWADVLTPPLSVIRPPTADLAARAWDVLMARMARRGGRHRRIVQAATLELRASVAPPQPRPTPAPPARSVAR